MTELATASRTPVDPAGRALHGVSYALAVLGGVLMIGLIGMVVASILGRSLLNTPIYGDFELVGIGTAIAVSLALPYCHMCRGNIFVDLFLAQAPLRLRLACDTAGSLLLSLLAGVLAWRTVLGAQDMITYHEVSIILAIPVWWAFPFVILSLALLSLCALYTAWRDARGLFA